MCARTRRRAPAAPAPSHPMAPAQAAAESCSATRNFTVRKGATSLPAQKVQSHAPGQARRQDRPGVSPCTWALQPYTCTPYPANQTLAGPRLVQAARGRGLRARHAAQLGRRDRLQLREIIRRPGARGAARRRGAGARGGQRGPAAERDDIRCVLSVHGSKFRASRRACAWRAARASCLQTLYVEP